MDDILIYRPGAYGPVEPEQENLAEIIIAKQRNGPVDTVELLFLKDYVQFANKEAFQEELPTISPDLF